MREKRQGREFKGLIERVLTVRQCTQEKLAKELGVHAQTISRMRGSLDWEHHYAIITRLQSMVGEE